MIVHPNLILQQHYMCHSTWFTLSIIEPNEWITLQSLERGAMQYFVATWQVMHLNAINTNTSIINATLNRAQNVD